MSSRWREFSPIDFRRRAIRLHEPGTQLRLPAYMVIVTLGFGSLLLLNAYLAFGPIFDATIATASRDMATLLEEQTANFFATTACICAAYVLTTVTICVTYVHRVIGPTIPLRRHIMALADGDYSSRVQLRGSDAAMEELADELNELARQLELNPAKIEN